MIHMYKVILFLSLLFVCCGQSVDSDSHLAGLAIDVEWDFQNDSIQVEIDNDVMYSGRVTTNYSISAAWTSGLHYYPPGSHLIEFKIYDYDLMDTFRFRLEDTVTVRVRFDRQQRQITFDTYDGIILRD